MASRAGTKRRSCRSSYIHAAILSLSEDIAPLEKVMGERPVVNGPKGLRANERRLLAFLQEICLPTPETQEPPA